MSVNTGIEMKITDTENGYGWYERIDFLRQLYFVFFSLMC